MAHADRDNAAQKIEVLLPIQVVHVLPLGMIDHQRVFVICRDAVKKVILIFIGNFVFSHFSILSGVVKEKFTVKGRKLKEGWRGARYLRRFFRKTWVRSHSRGTALRRDYSAGRELR